MSGHNKWSTIKHKKARIDAKKGRSFSRLSKELTLAAKRGGGDPEMNTRLRTAINSAKAINMPNDNIERAIKKGCGELDGQQMEELAYEAYGPGGVAMLIEVLTDNHNRSAADIRHILTRANTDMANAGAVSFMFQRKSRFMIEGEAADEVKLMELFFDAEVDVEDISVDEDIAEVIAPPEAFDAVAGVLEKAGITVSESGVVQVPDTETPITELSDARQIVKLIDTLEDYEDVQNVYTNADIPDEMLAQLSDEED